jgi:manganese transport protein
MHLQPWLRRLITRVAAILPALAVIAVYGDRGMGPLLILSHVVLSLQLPFAVIPLVMFTGDRWRMGLHVAPPWLVRLAWLVAGVIVILNGCLIYQICVQ